MIITIVADVLGQENNGTTITAKRLIKHLKERGHTVKVVSPLKTEEEGYYTLSTRSFGPFNGYVAKNGVELAKPVDAILYEAIKGSDIVHIMLPFKTGIRARKIAKKLNIPVTSACHCQAENVTSHVKLQNVKWVNRFIYRRFYRKFYHDVPYVHCPSAFIARTLKENGYDMDLRVISNGVEAGYAKKDAQKLEVLKDKITLLTIGRLSREKRHDLLIDAIALSKYKDQIQLVIAGRGPLEKATIKWGRKLPNKPIIGFYSQHDLVDIINNADLYVHPADIEIEAIACLEAITCGLVPVISDSTRSATNSFALEETNLFKAGDSQSLAEKIDYWIEHPEEKQELSKRYLEYSKQFEINHCITLMEQMFKDAIENYEK